MTENNNLIQRVIFNMFEDVGSGFIILWLNKLLANNPIKSMKLI